MIRRYLTAFHQPRWNGLLFALIATIFAWPNLTTQAQQANQKITAVVTTGMVGDLVRNVGGEYVEVIDLIPSGFDPHLYKATRSDVRKLSSSDIIFYSGLMLEGRMGDTFIKIARQGKPVYPVTEGIDQEMLIEPEEFEGQYDPHIWMDISAWIQTVEVVKMALSEIDPAHSKAFQKNADAYIEQLRKLDEFAKSSLASVPSANRKLITAHDAFNYFGRRYDIDVYGIQGISTTAEAGLQNVNALIDLVVGSNVEAIFVESSISDKNVRAIIEGSKARGHDVDLGGELFSDAMGPEGTYEGTYIGMMDHNITNITRGLGGDAPKAGLNGKLTTHIETDERAPSE